jgi:hypothetical protein
VEDLDLSGGYGTEMMLCIYRWGVEDILIFCGACVWDEIEYACLVDRAIGERPSILVMDLVKRWFHLSYPRCCS